MRPSNQRLQLIAALTLWALSFTLPSGCTRHPQAQSEGGLFVINGKLVGQESFPFDVRTYELSLRRIRLDGVERPPIPLRTSTVLDASRIIEPATRVRWRGGPPLQPFCHDQEPAARCGYALLEPHGEVELLGGTCSAFPPIALRRGGALLATTGCDAAAASTRVLLARRDGRTFDRSGRAVCELPLPVEIRTVVPESLAFAGESLYFIGDGSDGHQRVYRAPVDCSAAAVPVDLSDVAGKPPTVLQRHLGPSEGGRWLAIVGGPSSDERDVLVLDTRDDSLINLTDAPARYAAPSTDATGGDVEVSPDGAHVAFLVERANSIPARYELRVRRLDKSAESKGPPYPSYPFFPRRIRWLDGRALLAVQWVEPKGIDPLVSAHLAVGRYRPEPEQLEYLFRAGALPDWTSPDGAQLIYLPNLDPVISDTIVAIGRASGIATNVYSGAYDVVRARDSSRAFFVGYRKQAPGKHIHDIYSFDSNAPGPARRLTQRGVDARPIRDLTVRADGLAVAFAH